MILISKPDDICQYTGMLIFLILNKTNPLSAHEELFN
jgi:hypothetical protein